MTARKTLEKLFVNDKWKDSLTASNIKNAIGEFYKQMGDEKADRFADSLNRYKARVGRSYLGDMQSGILNYAFVLLTAGVVGPGVRNKLDPGFVVYLKANQVLSHLESHASRRDYKDIDYKKILEDLSEWWVKYVS